MLQQRKLLPLGLAFVIAAFAGQAPAADTPQSKTFDAEGVKIHYLIAGKGSPVVLIHGLYSSAQLNWQLPGILGHLARDHQVIALDLPGHGRSDKPDKAEAYGVQMADDVALLLDHLKIEKAHVVGYSLGGMVAAKFMTRHSDRVLSVTLGGMGWLRDGSLLQKFWDGLPANNTGSPPGVMVQSIAKLAITEEELKQVQAPVKVLVGDRDPVKGMYVTPLQQVRKDWPVVEIPDAGHILCILKPKFRDEIVDWLKMNSR
jgi:pimeloyl-ACP methyl ester carboxylesterase